MALLNGKTAEQIAKDIINKAVEPIIVEIDGVRGQDLDELVRYKFVKKIYSKGERWFQKNVDALRTEFLETVIEAQIKQRRKLDEKQQQIDNMEYYRELVSRGMSPAEALYESGLEHRTAPATEEAEDAEDAAEDAADTEESK